MKTSGLQALSSTFLEKVAEPWPKKIKIDRSSVNLKKEQQQLSEGLYYAAKKSNTTLCFPEVLRNTKQNGSELKNGNTTNVKTSIRPYADFKLYMNVNLQSRLFRNIPFYEKHILENRDCSAIGDICSELNELNILATNRDFWVLYAKEREKSIDTGHSWNEVATVSPIFNDIWAVNLITRIEALFKSVPVFQSNENGADFYHDHNISSSRRVYRVLKPVIVCNSSVRILPLCLHARHFMKGSKSDLGCLFYTNKNLTKIDNVLSFPKPTRCPANNNFRRNKEFQHVYKLYSRKRKRVINPKLVKCAFFELLLHDKRECNCGTANEKNDTSIFRQKTTFNIQLKEASKGSSSKECHVFSETIVKGDHAFLIDGNGKERKARQHALYDNRILQVSNIHSSAIWDTSLITAKKDLTAYSRHLNNSSSIPNMFEKLSFEESNLEMMVTMATCTQKKKTKAFDKNGVLRKFKTFHSVLRAPKKHTAKRFRNSIDFLKKRKNVHRYLGTCSKVLMSTRKYSNGEDEQRNHGSSMATKAHASVFETYKKITLSDDYEELGQISFISRVIFDYKNNGKHSKGHTATASKVTYNGRDTLAYFLPKLLFSAIKYCNYLLVQEFKYSQDPYDISTNSPVLKQKKSNMPFPINGPNSRNILSYTSIIFCDLCIFQNTIVNVKASLSKIALLGNRRKQNIGISDKMKSVLQDQPLVCNGLKHLKTVENMNILLQKGILLSCTHGSELVGSVKQNAEYERETEHTTAEKIYISKINHWNLILPSFKNVSAKTIGPEDRLMELSCAMKQEHFEDLTEKYLSSEFKNKSEFEMKNQFDLVLKELNVFNDISKEDKNSLQCEQRNIIQEDSLELSCLGSMLHEDSKNICKKKENVNFSTCSTTLNYTIVNENRNGQNLPKDRGLKRTGEQEVPHEDCSSRILDEELFYPASEEHFDSDCKQPLPWNPAFVSHTSTNRRSYSLNGEHGSCFSDGIIRVRPLKTCHGPLRVGLSRRAKPKQLHPYLK